MTRSIESILKQAREYPDRQSFRLKSKGAYLWLSRRKLTHLLDDIFPPRRRRWNLDSALAEAKKYRSAGEFMEKASGAYRYLNKNKKYRLAGFDERESLSLESCLAKAAACGSRKEFRKKEISSYSWLAKNGKLGELNGIFSKPITKKYLIENIVNRLAA